MQLVIWNSSLGVRDFVMIERVESGQNRIEAWLEEPYDIVGPFSMNDLQCTGKINFAKCIIMLKERWIKDQQQLREESYILQRKKHEKIFEELHRKNKIKQLGKMFDDKSQRALLDLPEDEKLKPSQIKAAFRKVAKRAHPDAGGSHEYFVQISKAKEYLLGSCL